MDETHLLVYLIEIAEKRLVDIRGTDVVVKEVDGTSVELSFARKKGPQALKRDIKAM